MRTAELTGAALDWVVAKCEGYKISKMHAFDGERACMGVIGQSYSPSTKWAQGGPIIEREWIDLHCVNDSLWEAECPATGGLAMQCGPTPLIAAMRCYVYSKLGDEIEIPEELK